VNYFDDHFKTKRALSLSFCCRIITGHKILQNQKSNWKYQSQITSSKWISIIIRDETSFGGKIGELWIHCENCWENYNKNAPLTFRCI